ncbi:hypothetical protein [Catellatospora coxensis]|uniref:hypothetical protein n=1 Tax=Catellatospora coxensis TaxID=310354 RepID=UPI001942AC44|nr:hypothetical protein [Catellatospora coxensis]
MAAAVALLLTGALGAAAPVTPLLTQVAELTLDGADGVLPGAVDPVRDLVLVHGGAGLSAYELADGSLRWRLPPSSGRGRGVQVTSQASDVLLVNEDFPDGGTSSSAVDVRTGAVRWTTGQYVWALGEYALESPPVEVRAEPESSGGGSPLREPMTMTVRELSTGRVRWVLRGAPFAAIDETAPEAWSVDERGEFTVHDLRDGRLLRTGRVAFPPGSPEMAAVYGGMLVLSARLPTGQYLETRYDTRTLRELSVTSSPLRFPCGGHLCEVGDVGGVRTPLAVLDRDTLAVRHRLEPNMNLLPSAQGAITVQMAGEGSLGANADRLIDLADGTTLLDLTGWGAQLAFDGSLDALLMRRVPDGVQVARIEDGRVRLLGTLPASLQRCFHTRQRIACVYDGDRLGVWSVAATA